MKTKWFNIPPRSLESPDKWRFWRTIALAIALRLVLKLTSFKTVGRYLKRFEKSHDDIPNLIITANELKMYRIMIRLSYKFWPAINCLSGSLAFKLMLQRRGIHTILRFGVMKDGNKLRSHAWLEKDGYPLDPDEHVIKKYRTFAEAIL
ncbi:MAG: lasso peptide biosynthesis B2 protein [Bacteroidetes bacterium]|nr:lasso peptide biosynthesis B2 protein [Bacteroidota bacterium]